MWLHESVSLDREIRTQQELRSCIMNSTLATGILALVAGILILAMPRLLNYVVAIYLILFGILTLIQYRPVT